MKELSDFKVGDHVIVSSVNDSEYAFLLGKAATVVSSDVPHKIKVEFDDQWCGYFLPNQLDFPASEKHSSMYKVVGAAEKVGELRCLIAVGKFVLNGCNITDKTAEQVLNSLYDQYDEAVKVRDDLLKDFWCKLSSVMGEKK